MSTAARRVRLEAREGRVTGQTAGLAPGNAQANLVILPRDHADDFRAFCERNPRPCPLLEQLDAGAYETSVVADGADVRTDLPRYRVWRDGSLHSECDDVVDLWRDDLVTFLIGCSFSFEEALLQARYRRDIAEISHPPMARAHAHGPRTQAGLTTVISDFFWMEIGLS